ncbi:MAG: ROK family protein [Eubacteriales bacterium]|nr:ROK family protein [Eubacteriales bacterium]
MLNLQKATITNIINDFYDLDIVGVDGDAASGRRGEKLCLKLDDMYVLSIGITRKDYQFSVFTLDGVQKKHICHCFGKNEDICEILRKMKKDAADLAAEYNVNRILDISLAVPGLFINRPEKNEEIFVVSEFEALSKVNIRKELEEVLKKRILVKHDAKLSAYAEWRCADEIQGIERASLAVVRSRGFGIGVGFVVNGAIMNGHLGLAGEVGYTGINYNGNRRGHERAGTFEYCAGIESLMRYVEERLMEFPQSHLRDNSTYQEILEEYRKGDPLAIWAVEKMAWMLGYGIANIIYTVNPDCIVIGPDYPDTEHFLRKVRESVRECVPPYVEECTVIRYSRLSSDSFLLGGYYYIMERFLSGDIFTPIREAKSI